MISELKGMKEAAMQIKTEEFQTAINHLQPKICLFLSLPVNRYHFKRHLPQIMTKFVHQTSHQNSKKHSMMRHVPSYLPESPNLHVVAMTG
jgi:hypothetical protein